jgi:NADH dehydrogenase FAD-containing subunit
LQTNILIIGGGYVGFYTALKLLNNEKIENIDIYDIDQKKINN